MGEEDKRQKSIQTATMVVVLLTNFVNPFAASSLNIAVPHISKEFHASATSLSWIVLSYIIVTVLLSVPFGRVANIIGRKTILKIGILIICISAALNIFSPSMPIFLTFRVLQGVGAAMIFATNIALLVSVFPVNKRGSALGIAVAATFTGASCGPVIGGVITNTFGWRGVFVAISALALAAFITATTRLPKDEKQKEKEGKLNVVSILLYMVSFGLIMYGFTTLTQNFLSYFVLGIGIVVFVFFVRHERRTKAPVLEVRIFENLKFSLSCLSALLNSAATYAMLYLMSIYLQLVKGYSADVSGLLMISQPIVQTVISPFIGRLSDRRPSVVIATGGIVCCVGALAMYAFMDEHTPMAYIFSGLILTGVGIGLFASPNSNMIMSSVSRQDYNVAASIQSTARTCGQVIGMAIITIVMNAVIGKVSIENVAAERIVFDLHITYWILAVICVIGGIVSLKRNVKNVV